MSEITLKDLAKMIDHSLLHPTMTDAEIIAGLELAKEYDVATACVKPYSVKLAAEMLAGTDVGVCAVIGFPAGNSTIEIKVAETNQVIRDGAVEVDMVINIAKALGGDWQYVSDEIKAINDACVSQGAMLKVIFETDYLAEDHIIKLCEICAQHKVAFVKTSTGFGFTKGPSGGYSYTGATEEHIRLMRKFSDPATQVKAAGGVRSLDKLLLMRTAGATRCGATATKVMLEEAKERGFQ
ncbi:MAG: deoxyribose-phosphate aldolase [Anaerolineae bacterium]|jgi:deoxyribose-phosphate aldolase|nr:deoxyribose-phosphate aldolase [Anaerolineae bacterium]